MPALRVHDELRMRHPRGLIGEKYMWCERGHRCHSSDLHITYQPGKEPKEKPVAASKRYLELLEEAKDLHIRKNAGYAGADNPDPWANFRMSEAFGVEAWRGALVRMTDKYIRIQNLIKDPSNDRVGESVIDTLRDLSAYALITVCLLEEEAAKQKAG